MIKNIGTLVSAMILVSAVSISAHAEEQKYALRFGGVVVDPTGSDPIQGENGALETAYGGELNFEWYFTPDWGLDISTIGATDFNNADSDYANGISISPFTVGLNYHPVITHTVDWSVGFLVGGVNYSDFEFDDDRFSSTFRRDFTYGVQTSVDLSPASWTHWGFNLGAKYLNSSAEFEGTPGEIKVDPLIWRAMLVYKW